MYTVVVNSTISLKTGQFTCDFASMVFEHCCVCVFQSLMVLSLLPPPVARRFGCHGHHAMAWAVSKRKSERFYNYENMVEITARASLVHVHIHMPSLSLNVCMRKLCDGLSHYVEKHGKAWVQD